MKRTLSILLLCGVAAAQTPTLTLVGPASARPGATVDVRLELAYPPASLAAMQWSIALPQGYTAAATAGAASTIAAKTLYCNAVNTLCLVVGINANLYAAGTVATYSIVIPANATPGLITISLSGLVGATLEGENAPLTAGPAYTVTVLASTDLNGDGRTDILDLQIIIEQILAGGAGTIRDVQFVARAAAGQ